MHKIVKQICTANVRVEIYNRVFTFFDITLAVLVHHIPVTNSHCDFNADQTSEGQRMKHHYCWLLKQHRILRDHRNSSTLPFVLLEFRPPGRALPIRFIATYGRSNPVCSSGHAVLMLLHPQIYLSIAALRRGMTIYVDNHSPHYTVVGFSHRYANSHTMMLVIRIGMN